jgi:hypothetical protein
MKILKSFFWFAIGLCTVYGQDYEPLIENIINQTNLDSLISYVRILSGEDSVRIGDSKELIQHRINARGNDLAADYIEQQLKTYGLETYVQNYSPSGRNVYARQPGYLFPEREIIICAHYDAVDYYCADDDASGVAAVLEAARILSVYPFNYTLIYALWDEEEIGLYGSTFYAAQANGNDTDIRGVINVDMIGWDSDDNGLIEIHSSDYASSNELANLLVGINSIYSLSLNPVIYDPGTIYSDHSPFWFNGYGAVLLIEAYFGGDFNPYYHSSEDRISRFNLPYFFNAAKLSIGSFSTLAYFEYPYDKVHPVQVSTNRTYFVSDLDTVWVTTEVNNPQDHSVQVLAILMRGDHGKVDSTYLYDDGLHYDMDASDGIFSGFFPPRTSEDMFTVGIKTFDSDSDYVHLIPAADAAHFTSAGPVVVSKHTVPLWGDNVFELKLYLTNTSDQVTVTDIKAEITSNDSNVTDLRDVFQNYGDISSGETNSSFEHIVYTKNNPDSVRIGVNIYSGEYLYWDDEISVDLVTGISSSDPLFPQSFALVQNYPNPFNPVTKIRYRIPIASEVELNIHNNIGQQVAALVSERKQEGTHIVEWDASGYASGIYYARIRAGEFQQVRKMVLLK